jgi:hypothetical protein
MFKRRCEYCGTALYGNSRYTVRSDRLRRSEALVAFKMSNSEMGGKCKKPLGKRPEWGPAGAAVL